LFFNVSDTLQTLYISQAIFYRCQTQDALQILKEFPTPFHPLSPPLHQGLAML
jgi:hypothetical protein